MSWSMNVLWHSMTRPARGKFECDHPDCYLCRELLPNIPGPPPALMYSWLNKTTIADYSDPADPY